MIKHIPFSGPGKYKLVNGQIVNLNEKRLCLESDMIKNSEGFASSWIWSPDGTTNGLGFPIQDNSLFLAEKIEEEEEYYFPKRGSIFDHGVYWTKIGKDWWYHNKFGDKYRDVSSEKYFQDGINRSSLIKCTKEDALKYYENIAPKPTPPKGYIIADDEHVIKDDDLVNSKHNRGLNHGWISSCCVGKKVKELAIPIDVSTKVVEQKIIGTIVSTSSCGWNISNGKTYNVYDVGNTIVKIEDDAGNIHYYDKKHFGPVKLTEEKPAPKMLVAKITNGYLKKGQSYEVVGDYHPKNETFKVKVSSSGYALHFWSDCFESEVSSSDATNVGAVAPKKEEEVMQKETAVKVATVVSKTVGNFVWKMANYWLLEPAANVGRPIVKSVRYAVFLGTIATAIYGYRNPEVVKNAVKSCIPKVTIEAPEIMKG